MPRRDEILRHALALHRAGRLDEAEALYRDLLEANPGDAGALHLLGVAADSRGDHQRAVQLIDQALALRESSQFHSNRAMALLHLGQPEAALGACSRALELRADYPEALTNLGAALEALDRPAEAEQAYRRALALRPDSAETWCNLGNVLRLSHRPEEAEEAYRHAVALGPALAVAHGGLGRLLRDAGRPNEAEPLIRRQVALTPDDPEAHVNLSAVLAEPADCPNTAEASQAEISQAQGQVGRPEAQANLGTALRQLRRFAEAELACRRALALRPDHPQAMSNLGNVLRELGRLAEAEPIQRRALALRPAETNGYRDLALTLMEANRPHEALAVLDLAAALDPGDADTRYHRATVLLLMGRLPEGWLDYEARFDTKQGRADRRVLARPKWTGEPLAGRTILLYAEQGLGDTIQFCRYVPLVAARGARVVLEIPPALRRLLSRLEGVAQIVGQGEALPPYDLCCPLMSLPHVFATSLDTIPSGVPYLEPPADTAAAWRDRLPDNGARRVGVAWAGNPRHANDHRRSLPFAALAPLWELPDIRWHSLQVGARAADLAATPRGQILDLSTELHDFAETAAALRRMDVLVTPDTAVAHLAGALGVAAYVMLPAAPDWRWMRGGSNSRWYPSLRLFRQDAPGLWGPVVRAVAASLSGDAGALKR